MEQRRLCGEVTEISRSVKPNFEEYVFFHDVR